VELDLIRKNRHIKAFTLIELLVGLLVTSIILSAVATLAFALSSANTASDDTAFKQTQLRHATLRVSDLIRTCRLICAAPGNDLVVWAADTNDIGHINLNELVYIERGAGLDRLRLTRLFSSDNPRKTLSELRLPTTKTELAATYGATYAPLIPDCNNLCFYLDRAPPATRLVSITFDLTENRIVRRYQITAGLRAWAGHLLNDVNEIVDSDDD
jgi:prepilin-type N-terminal cleavage/methylation domain-containing protein